MSERDKVYTYDSECETLAEYFLSDEESYTELALNELSQNIQDTIEDWLEFDLPRLKKAKS